MLGVERITPDCFVVFLGFGLLNKKNIIPKIAVTES